MELNIITIHYHPLSFLRNSLENNYNIFKKENIKFKHYLLDNNFPLENNQQKKVKELCDNYNITYLNGEKNLGLVESINYFNEKLKDIVFHLESDAFLISKNVLSSIKKMHAVENENLFYLNNKNLNDYEKNIFQINDVNVFELDIKNLNHTWIQCFNYNLNTTKKLHNIINNKNRNNYDFPGENNDKFKEENIPFLIMNDLYEDMEKYRFQNYFEYEYYKTFVYYWSKFEKEHENLTFEEFINNYDYYLNMEDKIIACYSNLKLRSKNFVISPNFYFEKTKKKFNYLHIKNKFNYLDTKKIMDKIKLNL